jgi:hypothetical protein
VTINNCLPTRCRAEASSSYELASG